MTKSNSIFICKQCGERQLSWRGRCPVCGEWNSLIEKKIEPTSEDKHRKIASSHQAEPIHLVEDLSLSENTEEAEDTIKTGICELDRVLGGRILKGTTILLGGSPGIGKSTLMLQVAGKIGKSGKKVMYITSEESIYQIKTRAKRLKIEGQNVYVDAQTNLETIINHVRKYRPEIVIIDSVQLIYKPDLLSSPGGLGQLKQCGTELVWLAKSEGITVIMVGHITKDGTIAGPKIIEHIVDVVLYFEGDASGPFRLIRASKNRFGPTNEIGIFKMEEEGLVELSCPQELLIQPRNTAGVAFFPSAEGSRILILEIQALTSPSIPSSVKRKTSGLSPNRIAMIIAVLEKHNKLRLTNKDIFANVVGGIKVKEPAADLAIAAAIASAYTERSLPEKTVLFGEVGLTGEIRPVSDTERRITEAEKLGFTRAIIPARSITSKGISSSQRLEITTVRSLQEVISMLK